MAIRLKADEFMINKIGTSTHLFNWSEGKKKKSVQKTGKISRAYLGVRYVLLNEQIAQSNNLPSNTGALVYASGNQIAVVPNSPADKAGIKENDIIIKIDGVDINEENSISTVIAKKKPGETVTITILRDGKEQQVKATLEEAPNLVNS